MHYILLMFITLHDGYQEMHYVSNVDHKTYQSCYVEKRSYRDSDTVEYLCGKASKYFNKQQKLY